MTRRSITGPLLAAHRMAGDMVRERKPARLERLCWILACGLLSWAVVVALYVLVKLWWRGLL